MFDNNVFNGFYREAGNPRGTTSLSPFGLKSAAKVLLFSDLTKSFTAFFSLMMKILRSVIRFKIKRLSLPKEHQLSARPLVASLAKNFSFADFRHDSAIQASLIALAAPKVQLSTFNSQLSTYQYG